jgi:hypothetical protein
MMGAERLVDGNVNVSRGFSSRSDDVVWQATRSGCEKVPAILLPFSRTFRSHELCVTLIGRRDWEADVEENDQAWT